MKKVSLYILTVFFLASCGQEGTENPVPENEEPEAIVCDTLLPFTIDLLKNDSVKMEFAGIVIYDRVHFTNRVVDPETRKSSFVQVPLSDSTSRKLSGNTKYDGLDLNTIFAKGELQAYAPIPVLKECIDRKIISADTLAYWNDQYQKELSKDKNFSAPSEWFSYIEISTPVLSKSGDYIYVEIDQHSGHLRREASSYLFHKVDGKWKCVGRWDR